MQFLHWFIAQTKISTDFDMSQTLKILPQSAKHTAIWDILSVFANLNVGGFNISQGRWIIPAKWVHRCAFAIIHGYLETRDMAMARTWAICALKSNPRMFDDEAEQALQNGMTEAFIL